MMRRGVLILSILLLAIATMCRQIEAINTKTSPVTRRGRRRRKMKNDERFMSVRDDENTEEEDSNVDSGLVDKPIEGDKPSSSEKPVRTELEDDVSSIENVEDEAIPPTEAPTEAIPTTTASPTTTSPKDNKKGAKNTKKTAGGGPIRVTNNVYSGDQNDGEKEEEPKPDQGVLVPGVEQMGMGFDIAQGKFKLPMFKWKSTRQVLNSRPPLRGSSIPSGVAVSTTHSGKRTEGPVVFSSQAQYTRYLAKRMNLPQPEGALTMSQEADSMRDINLYSDLTIKSTEYTLYQLSVFPDTNGYDLMSAVLSAMKSLPDCRLTDCVVSADEDIAVGDKGCRASESSEIYMPHMSNSKVDPAKDCLTWSTQKSAKKDGGPQCVSKFFKDVTTDILTKASNTFKVCPDTSSLGATNADRDCIAFGHDEGNICNAYDLKRIASFVEKWGTHMVVGGEFGGSFSQLVQTKKDSPWKQAVTGQEKVFNFPETDLPGLEANTALRGMAFSSPSFPHSFPYNSSGLLSTTELRHTIEERTGLEDMGIQSLKYHFEGGSKIPVSTEKLYVDDVRQWIDSLSESPSMLQHTIQLIPINELFDHVMLEKNNVMSDDVRLRKRMMLGNFLKYWTSKSSTLGTLLDQAAVVKSQQDFQLARMHGSVSDTIRTMNEIETKINDIEKQGNSNSNVDVSMELNRVMARGVITWQQSSQRYVGTCRSACDLSYVTRMRRQMMYGRYDLPSQWQNFPPPPDPTSFDGLKSLRDVLRVDRNSCYSSCTNDVTLARQSHEPEGYVGGNSEKIHQFFSLVKAGCLICRGLVQELLNSAVFGNGRGSISSEAYCKNDIWSSWSDAYYQSQVFDVTQPYAFSRSNTQKESPKEFDYPNRFCLGLADVIREPLVGFLERNGLKQGRSDQNLYETLQVYAMTLELTPEELSEKVCSDYAGCAPNGPGPIEREIATEQAKIESLKEQAEANGENMKALDTFLKTKGLDKDMKTRVTKQRATLKKDQDAENAEIKTIQKTLASLTKQHNATTKAQKTVESQCLFECYKQTNWGKSFLQKTNRIDSGLQDPIPQQQLTAMRSTTPCGYPIRLKREPDNMKAKCNKCSQLSCLVQARLKCYAYSCKSPYVSTNGVAYYVPKTIVI